MLQKAVRGKNRFSVFNAFFYLFEKKCGTNGEI